MKHAALGQTHVAEPGRKRTPFQQGKSTKSILAISGVDRCHGQLALNLLRKLKFMMDYNTLIDKMSGNNSEV